MSCGGLGMMQVSTLQNPSLSMMSFGGNKNLQVFVSFIFWFGCGGGDRVGFIFVLTS